MKEDPTKYDMKCRHFNYNVQNSHTLHSTIHYTGNSPQDSLS